MTFKSEIVFVRILFPFLAGIILAYLFPQIFQALKLAIFTFSLLTLHLCINHFYVRLKAYNFQTLLSFFIYAYWFIYGGLNCLLYQHKIYNNFFGPKRYNHIKVWIDGEPQQKSGIIRFEAMVVNGYIGTESKRLSGKLLIALKTNLHQPIQLHYGDELLISCDYQPVERPYNPGEFDFSAWLAARNVYYQTFINPNQVIKLNQNKGNSIINYALAFRKRQVEVYRKLLFGDEAFAVASTLILGYRADLSKDTLNAYSKTGTIHALSVSGMHVGIIYIFLNWVLSFLNRSKIQKIIKVILICSLVWYYSLLTGFSPSVLRSAIMLTVYIIAKAFNQNSNAYNILAFTAFLLLVWNPFLIWDVGFQLSFLAVLGLIYLQPKIYKWFYVKNKWLDQLWSTVALSIAAQIATFPLSIFYFHQFPVYFIFSNLFILIPLTIMMYMGIAILLLRLFFLAVVFEWIIDFTNSGLKWIAELPFSGVSSIWISHLELILLSFSLLFFILALQNYHKKLLFISVYLFLIFQSERSVIATYRVESKQIIYFSLRRNFAAAFIAGRKAVLLTNVKSSERDFEFFIKPALDQLQVKHTDLIDWEKDTISTNFIKRNHQVIFYDYKILLIDSFFNKKYVQGVPKFKAVWLHQNPDKTIKSIRNEIAFETIIIDATNKDYLIKKYEQESQIFDVNQHTLKKNKAYLVNIN